MKTASRFPALARGMAAVFLSAVLPVSAAAQKAESGHFRKGIFAGAEISSGISLAISPQSGSQVPSRGGTAGRLMPDYAFGLFCGYRILPQLAAAAGFEGSNSVVTGTTSLPVFIRLRCDLSDRKVSPFIQVDAGFAFQFTPSRRSSDDIAMNTEPFPERFSGFASADDYLDAHVSDYLGRFTGLPQDELDRIAGEERERERIRLCSFANGQRSYLPTEALRQYGHFSKDGFFGCMTLGIGVGLGKERQRLSLGVAAGVAQCSMTVSLRAQDSSFRNFSVADKLPDGTAVITECTSLRDKALRTGLRVRIGYEF